MGDSAAIIAQLTAVIQGSVSGLQTQLEARFVTVETNVSTLSQHMANAEIHITSLTNQLKEVSMNQQHQKQEIQSMRANTASSSASTASGGQQQQTWASRLFNDDGNKRRRGEYDVGGDPTTKFIGHFPRAVLERVRRNHFESLPESILEKQFERSS